MKELKWRDILIRTALVLATMAIVVWCMPRDNRSYFHVEQGKPWKYAEFTAPYDFPIYKSEAVIQEERDSAMRKYEPYYNYQQDVARKMILKFETDYADGIPGLPRIVCDHHLQSVCTACTIRVSWSRRSTTNCAATPRR